MPDVKVVKIGGPRASSTRPRRVLVPILDEIVAARKLRHPGRDDDGGGTARATYNRSRTSSRSRRSDRTSGKVHPDAERTHVQMRSPSTAEALIAARDFEKLTLYLQMGLHTVMSGKPPFGATGRRREAASRIPARIAPDPTAWLFL